MKLFIATPMYGGQCAANYHISMTKLIKRLVEKNINYENPALVNESCIARARTYISDVFIQSDCTHLLFWDADVGAKTDYVFQLLEADKDIVCGLYPRKEIGGGYVFTPIGEIKKDEPSEVLEVGCGFMMIQRHVFDKISELHPELLFYPDTCKDVFGDRLIMAYFIDAIIDKRFLTEDYFFCYLARSVGARIWVCPWMKLTHQGAHIFR
jgi:hypothetical protein